MDIYRCIKMYLTTGYGQYGFFEMEKGVRNEAVMKYKDEFVYFFSKKKSVFRKLGWVIDRVNETFGYDVIPEQIVVGNVGDDNYMFHELEYFGRKAAYYNLQCATDPKSPSIRKYRNLIVISHTYARHIAAARSTI